MADTTPPAGGADTISPKPTTTTEPPAATADRPIIGTSATFEPKVDDRSIRPFEFHASDEALDDLKRRILATRWPARELVDDDTQGVQLATIQKLADYWSSQYDWRRVEVELNSYPQFTTRIDGLDIHFIQVKSRHPNALPLIVTHGWPGSVIEQMKIIKPLTDPTSFGGTEDDGFHVVIPSIPGFGFSEKPTQLGWGPERIAKAWGELMGRLGYDRYVAQGGDWGAIITDLMGVQQPKGLLGIHTNMACSIPPEIDAAAFTGIAPPGLNEDEQAAFDQLSFFYRTDLAYAQQMGTHPQTLYGIEDSPIQLAAWILDHDIRSYRLISRVFDGETEGLSKDDILDNITLTWLTSTGISSARLYWENKLPFFTPKGVKLPTVVSVFPDEISPAPRSWVEKAYPNLLRYQRHPKGGHFAAWEQPQAIIEDLREGFRSLR